MAENLETPIVEEEVREEETKEEWKANPKVERILKIFEALEGEDQTKVFDQISVIMLPNEWTPPEELDADGKPITEGLPFVDDNATAPEFNALQWALQNF